MKKEHFCNYYYQKLSINQKVNLKAYFVQNLSFDFCISEFEFLCVTE